MYKPSKIKHPSARRSGKKKKGEPAYASGGTISVGPDFAETAAEELAYGNATTDKAEGPAAAESTKDKTTTAEATTSKPAAAESTTDEPTAVASAQEPKTESRTGEETHKPVLNVDEQNKVVNSSGATTNDNAEEF